MRPEREGLTAAAQALGLAVSARQVDQLMTYLELLRHWNATHNLTAVRDAQAMLKLHLVDCMAAVPALTRWLDSRPGERTSTRVMDVGSGGGLPGLVWAVLCPSLSVTCVDSVGKKAAFLRQAAGALALDVDVRHARVESLRLAPFDLITSRAFASLADFVSLTTNLLAPDGQWLAMKGQRPSDEMAALPGDIAVFHVEPLQVPGLDAQRCLVWLERQPQGAERGAI